jgi:chloramphenicol 3-O-phosphotransferase
MEILDNIEQWAYNVSDTSPRLFWLTGVPGIGKSSVATSIARTFDDKKFLWAQLFISHSHVSTTNPNHIFPSIAQQLAERDLKAALAIHAALKKQHSLVHNITSDQAVNLFVEPIKVISALHPSDPNLVVIDAFDEIEGDVSETAKILSKAITALPQNAKVFIPS